MSDQLTDLNVSRIVALHAENTMRLKAVDLTPPEHLVVVAGDNEQGKSSLLRSIEMALAGADVFPEMPVRKGQKRAVVDIDLGDLKIHRTISSSGSTTLTVKAKDGSPLDTPQKILDALRGKRSFDPMEFMKLKPEAQAATLRTIAGLDTAALDAEYQKLYAERTMVNRERDRKKAVLAGMAPLHADAPAERQSSAAIMAEHQKASEHNQQNNRARSEVEMARGRITAAKNRVEGLKGAQDRREEELVRLKAAIAEAEQRIKHGAEEIAAVAVEIGKAETHLEKLVAHTDSLKDIDLAQFSQRVLEVERINEKVAHNEARKAREGEYQEKEKESDALTRKLSAIETQKSDLVQNAKYPVPGLGFTDAGTVAYNGVPFDQASTSVQLKVSVAIGLALNPKMRILLIRNGNDLDDKNLALLAEMAREHKAQIWLERVDKKGDVAVIIEDGGATIPPSKENKQPELV